MSIQPGCSCLLQCYQIAASAIASGLASQSVLDVMNSCTHDCPDHCNINTFCPALCYNNALLNLPTDVKNLDNQIFQCLKSSCQLFHGIECHSVCKPVL